MPKKFFKRFFPSPEKIRRIPSLSGLRPLFRNPNAWHVNRRSVSRAFLIGIFSAFLPIPFQMVVAAFIAFYCNANVPISVGLVWISNPITIPPIFYATYQFGTLILGRPSREFSIELSINWFLTELTTIWQPLLIGSLIAGTVLALIAYASVLIAWRMHVIKNWERRKARRASKSSDTNQ